MNTHAQKKQKLSLKNSFPEQEHIIQELWIANTEHQKNNIYTTPPKEITNTEVFTLFDGPPFATGLPHFGHFVPSTIKDTVLRAAQKQGLKAPKQFGWDCHGVPVELVVQKKHGLNGKTDIENLGIASFNQLCRQSVLEYTEQWKEYMALLGRQVDTNNAYKTMDDSYMASVWSVFKALYDKGLIAKQSVVASYSTALGTTLSNFEASLDYRQTQDTALTIAIPLQGAWLGSRVLVWTTTPWTLPANQALAIDPSAIYVQVQLALDIENKTNPAMTHMDKHTDTTYILAESCIESCMQNRAYTVIKQFLGAELAGTAYTPIFLDYVQNKNTHTYTVLSASFIEAGTGTGVVHIAPAFGEDDYHLGLQYGLPCVDHLSATGETLPPIWETQSPIPTGMYFKELDKWVIKTLKHQTPDIENTQVWQASSYVHSYPFCYRSGTPLVYRAVPSWVVKVEGFRQQLLTNNQKIRWVPDHIQQGRFGKWLENARNWNISRSRYWGNPLPIWENTTTGALWCFGSIQELDKAIAGEKVTDIHGNAKIFTIQTPITKKTPAQKIQDTCSSQYISHSLHRENLDGIVFAAVGELGLYTRVPFVLDCWFESGCMPYASQGLHVRCHTENTDTANTSDSTTNHIEAKCYAHFDATHPIQTPQADFICEGLDQTRGWFYSLHVISSLLFDQPAFTNVVVNGLILAEDGKKMSKSLQNYPDPLATLHKFGADAMRLFLLNSPAVFGAEVRFSEEGLKQITNQVLVSIKNALSFLELYTQEARRRGEIICFDYQYLEADPTKPEDLLDLFMYEKALELQTNIRSILSCDNSVEYTEPKKNNLKLYHFSLISRYIIEYLDQLNNFYIQKNRNRARTGDMQSLRYLYLGIETVLHSLAPLAPFNTDAFYHILRTIAYNTHDLDFQSIHTVVFSMPQHRLKQNTSQISSASALLYSVPKYLEIQSLGLRLRKELGIPRKKPIHNCHIQFIHEISDYHVDSIGTWLQDADSLNIKNCTIDCQWADKAYIKIKPNFKAVGAVNGKMVPMLKRYLDTLTPLQTQAVFQFLKANSIKNPEYQDNTMPSELSPFIHSDYLECILETMDKSVLVGTNFIISFDTQDPHGTYELEYLGREMYSQIQKIRKEKQLPENRSIYVYYTKQSAMWNKPEIQWQIAKDEGRTIWMDTLPDNVRHIATVHAIDVLGGDVFIW
jgi:isoleucyl-tRNA synthetase